MGKGTADEEDGSNEESDDEEDIRDDESLEDETQASKRMQGEKTKDFGDATQNAMPVDEPPDITDPNVAVKPER